MTTSLHSVGEEEKHDSKIVKYMYLFPDWFSIVHELASFASHSLHRLLFSVNFFVMVGKVLKKEQCQLVDAKNAEDKQW